MIIAKLDMEMPLSCEECTFHSVTIKGWDEFCELAGRPIYSALSRPKECPLADAEKHGRWERVAEQPYFRKHYHTLCCSECHEKGQKWWHYCPNCGAKME